MFTEKNPEVALRSVTTLHGRVYVRDRGRDEPVVGLMHVLPDDSPIYERLAPELLPERSVALDFVGHAHSERLITSQDCSPAQICTAWKTHPIGPNGISPSRWPS